jgi:hypothetical protein
MQRSVLCHSNTAAFSEPRPDQWFESAEKVDLFVRTQKSGDNPSTAARRPALIPPLTHPQMAQRVFADVSPFSVPGNSHSCLDPVLAAFPHAETDNSAKCTNDTPCLGSVHKK